MKKHKKSDTIRGVLMTLGLAGCAVSVHICRNTDVLSTPEIIVVVVSMSLSLGAALSNFIDFD